MPFAQLVVGPPGSGKSTYCDGSSFSSVSTISSFPDLATDTILTVQQFMRATGRKCSIVNLDPANDHTSYESALDIRNLVTLDEIMGEEGLGPNGGVLFALEELEENYDWLTDGLKRCGDDYVLFDCPGQVELFTHHNSLRNIFLRIQQSGYRLVTVHLTDSYTLTLPSLYISTLLLSLRSMLQLDLPSIHVLTKIDNLASYAPLPFHLEFYTEVQSLSYLLPHLAIETGKRLDAKFEKLNKTIVNLIEDFSLVGFETLAVEDRQSMMQLLRKIDRAGGFAFGGAEGTNETVWQVAVREEGVGMSVRDVQERWVDAREAFDERERELWKEEGERAREGAGDAGT
ncbi:MAG: hypothetical protein M1814_003268 [Vezdaea aestivalis]|nr:MAG: hypothetical protein M1814_003268 [Vezdaea aestivalis]